MIRTLLLSTLLPIAAITGAVRAAPAPQPAVHCQVPCGIFGDSLRIDMLMEDAATIEKGMTMIKQLEAEAGASANQLVRWVLTKDQHAESIQETIASYWLAQRVKAPTQESAEAREAYHRQLELLHGITIAAMKCKQTTEQINVTHLRELALAFSATYFSGQDLEHIQSHHGQSHHGAEHK